MASSRLNLSFLGIPRRFFGENFLFPQLIMIKTLFKKKHFTQLWFFCSFDSLCKNVSVRYTTFSNGDFAFIFAIWYVIYFFIQVWKKMWYSYWYKLDNRIYFSLLFIKMYIILVYRISNFKTWPSFNHQQIRRLNCTLHKVIQSFTFLFWYGFKYWQLFATFPETSQMKYSQREMTRLICYRLDGCFVPYRLFHTEVLHSIKYNIYAFFYCLFTTYTV